MKAAYQFEVMIDDQPVQVSISQDAIRSALAEGEGSAVSTFLDAIVAPVATEYLVYNCRDGHANCASCVGGNCHHDDRRPEYVVDGDTGRGKYVFVVDAAAGCERVTS